MMTLREFTEKHESILNSTHAGVYRFVKRHQKTLEEMGAIQVVQKLEREFIVVQNEKKLLNFIKEKQTNKRLRGTKKLEVVEA